MTINKKRPGRPIAEPTYPVMLRLTEPYKSKYLELGGARWVKRLIGEAMELENYQPRLGPTPDDSALP